MMNKGILPLSCGGGAALISVFTGFISGVTPGTLLLRGLLSALAAVVFVLLSSWLIDTYLPELGLNSVKGGDDNAASPGSRVNIVMSDDANEQRSPDSGGAQGEDAQGGSGLEGVRENEIAETSGSVHNNKPEDPDLDPLDSEGVDTLPNLDSLEINMGDSSTESDDQTESMETESPVTNLNVSSKQGEHGDPEEIAKAVKTVLARDK